MSPAETVKQNGIPLYHQLKEIFLDKIATGEWKPGDVIPNEQQLCQQYGVSRGPMRQALDLLVRQGLFSRKQGKGTCVTPPKIERSLGSLYSYTTLIQQRGMHPTMRLLAFDLIQATANVARALDLPPNAPTFCIRRLRLADAEPLILETVYVPEYVCRGLSADEISAAPLYDVLQKQYGVVLERAKQFFEPTITDEYEAEVLQVPKGSPALLVQNTTYALRDRPVVFSKAIMRGDRVRYYVELNAQVAVP